MIRLLIFLLAAGFGDSRNPSNASLPIWLIRGRRPNSFLGLSLNDRTIPLQRWAKKLVLGCMIPPLAVGATSRNLGQTFLPISVLVIDKTVSVG